MKKYYWPLLLLFGLSLPVQAEERRTLATHPGNDTVFLELPAEAYPLHREQLPRYTTTMRWDHPGAPGSYRVSVVYPEYLPLKGHELKWARMHRENIPEQVRVDSHLGYSRRKGYLDLSFCPIVRKEDRYYRIVSCKLNIAGEQAATTARTAAQTAETAADAERWKKQSVLRQGKWVKIRVKKEGIYALTPSFLAQKGFKHPERVKLYGYGGRIQQENWVFGKDGQVIDDLEEIPLCRKDNGNALFFAEGTIRWTYNPSSRKWTHENNPYSKYSYYFITEGDNPATLPVLKTQQNPNYSTATVPYYAVIDNDDFGWYHGGREMYDEYDFAYGPTHTFKLNTPSIEQQKKKSNIDISFSASSMFSSTMVTVAHNKKQLGNLSIPRFGKFQSAFEVRKSFSAAGEGPEQAFDIKVSPANPARLNFIRMEYTRRLDAQDAPFSFTPNYAFSAELKIANATADTRLWRIGSYGYPAGEIDAQLNGSTLVAKVEEGMQRYVIVDLNKSYATPEWDSPVGNQDLHGDLKAYDMVIIIPESERLREQAEILADAHRNLQGLRVKVVNAGQIYNEFSSGTPDATAYRRYMKMLYDRAATDADLPRYLLLFGNCAWDNRMITDEYRSDSPKDYLLSFEVTNGFLNPNNTTFPLGEQDSYVTDDYFGWLDDQEGNAYASNRIDLSIGRFPCTDAETAATMVSKSIQYLTNKNVGSWKNTIYMLADNGNSNLHMENAEDAAKQIATSTHHNAVIKKVYNDAYTRVSSGTAHTFPAVTQLLHEAMEQGALVFNYTGHGNPSQLSHSQILTLQDFERPGKGNLPLWVMASCEISPYDSKRKNIGVTAFENKTGGAVAVMCASRSVYSNYNSMLNIAYNKHLFHVGENGQRNAMGDALRLTKVELVSPSSSSLKDNSINKLKYLLLGDPALPLTFPTGKVVLDSINGQRINSQLRVQLKAGALARFSGHLADHAGKPLNDFSGSVTATVADRLEEITCKNNDGSASQPMVYQDRTKKIFEGSDSVRNGRFCIAFRVPRDISYTEDNGRITFYAVDNEKQLECHGANEQFYLNGTDTSSAPDTLAPKVFLYLDHPDFPNGGVTSPNPVFFAKIQDDTGINAAGTGIGHDMELVIDGKQSSPIVLNNNFSFTFGNYREGLVSYPMEQLEYGRHTLSFRAWDVNGNSTTGTLQFSVQDGVNDGFNLYATENPARTSTRFVTTFSPGSEDPHNAVFEVYSLSGQLLWQSPDVLLPAGSGHGIAEWNLTNSNGARVPAGIYLYKVTVRGNGYKNESKAKKMIVLEQ